MCKFPTGEVSRKMQQSKDVYKRKRLTRIISSFLAFVLFAMDNTPSYTQS